MTMDVATVMGELERLGTAQNRKIYGRHGMGENTFGVSYANLKQLKKQIKTDPALAQALWATGNHDARILATMIAAPRQMTEDQIEQWVHSLHNYAQADAFAGIVAQTAYGRAKAEAWVASDEEQIARAGWTVLALLTTNDAALLDSYFEPYLARIERDIHQARNRIRQAMNNTLIAIGSRSAALEPLALAAAARIGKVDIDHGETACETPDAASYIRKTRAHRESRAKATA